MKFGPLVMPSILLKIKFNKTTGLNLIYKFNLETQRVVSQLLFVFTGPLIYFLVFKVFGYRLANSKAVREKFNTLIDNSNGPTIICSNHLSLIDSIIHSVFLNSLGGYFANFDKLPWHLPEKRNFYHKIHWRILCYLGKCIPVQRLGNPQKSKQSLYKMNYVLDKGGIISIFPEGTRSRSGVIDTVNHSYAVGQLIKNYQHCNVICIYLRGKTDGSFSDFPQKHQEFYMDVELINPTSDCQGIKRARDLSTQIIEKLKEMEGTFEQLCRK